MIHFCRPANARRSKNADEIEAEEHGEPRTKNLFISEVSVRQLANKIEQDLNNGPKSGLQLSHCAFQITVFTGKKWWAHQGSDLGPDDKSLHFYQQLQCLLCKMNDQSYKSYQWVRSKMKDALAAHQRRERLCKILKKHGRR